MNSPDFQADGLDRAALSENRAGRITPAQGRAVLEQDRGTRIKQLAMAGIALIVVPLVLTRVMRGMPPTMIVTVTGVFVAVPALAMLVTVLSGGAKRDVREGKVVSVDGTAVRRGGGNGTFFVRFGDELLKVNQATYNAVSPQAHTYRAYYLPRSSRLVNLEILT